MFISYLYLFRPKIILPSINPSDRAFGCPSIHLPPHQNSYDFEMKTFARYHCSRCRSLFLSVHFWTHKNTMKYRRWCSFLVSSLAFVPSANELSSNSIRSSERACVCDGTSVRDFVRILRWFGTCWDLVLQRFFCFVQRKIVYLFTTTKFDISAIWKAFCIRCANILHHRLSLSLSSFLHTQKLVSYRIDCYDECSFCTID